MADRILTWHSADTKSDNARIGATYYMESDYTPIAVRIHAEKPPVNGDALVDIRDEDGVSIFANRTPTPVDYSGRESILINTTSALLIKGESYEESAEDFKQNDLILEKGSWLSCFLVSDAGGKNFTVSLELEKFED